MMKCNENKKGFTLAELLIVIAIIAILVAIAVPIFSAQLEKANLATDAANMRNLQAYAATLENMGEIELDGNTIVLPDPGSGNATKLTAWYAYTNEGYLVSLGSDLWPTWSKLPDDAYRAKGTDGTGDNLGGTNPGHKKGFYLLLLVSSGSGSVADGFGAATREIKPIWYSDKQIDWS